MGPDNSDEDPSQCHKQVECPWNQAHCGDGFHCIPVEKFCDNHGDCPDNSDEWDYCRTSAFACKNLQCTYGCRPTKDGAKCFCPNGQKPNGSKCVDANECELDDSCAQICTNKIGGFDCSCVSGYEKNGSNCIALNGKID